MQSLEIQDTRIFMHHLLTADTFHAFLAAEAELVTFAAWRLEGTYRPDFFDGAEQEENVQREDLVEWPLVQPHVRELIRGTHTPLKLSLVLRLKKDNVDKLLRTGGISSLTADDIAGLYLNIRYENKTLVCTTGTSLRVFTADRTLEHTWDDMICRLLRQKQIPFTVR